MGRTGVEGRGGEEGGGVLERREGGATILCAFFVRAWASHCPHGRRGVLNLRSHKWLVTWVAVAEVLVTVVRGEELRHLGQGEEEFEVCVCVLYSFVGWMSVSVRTRV